MGQGRGQPSHRGPPPPTTRTAVISYVDRFEDLYMTTTYEEDICRPCLSDQTDYFDDNPEIEYVFMTTVETPAGPPTVLGPPQATDTPQVMAIPIPQLRSQQEID